MNTVYNHTLTYSFNMQEMIKVAKDRLITSVLAYNPQANITCIEQAFKCAYEAHKTQFRASGEPYILHPIAVAQILAELKLDNASIITALLHDTVEDTGTTLTDIENQFGKDVARLVDGVTKLEKISYQPEHIKQAENFRKLLIAISKDIRVLLVKLADRVHNMRTLSFFENKEKRLRIAHETMEIYAPLAERLGIHKFKNELQDLAFAELHPDIRASILSRLAFLRKEGLSLVDTIVNEISKLLKDHGIEAKVSGREKTSCSIWHKMESKNVAFEQLADIIAFRVIVHNISDCYKVLGVLHTEYHVVPETFKDYISTPKNNGYKSLHTVLVGPARRCIEVQIRTEEMHEIAELGLAAHWAYKQDIGSSLTGLQFRWVRELLEILENASSPEEFMENTKLEMYYDQVFCFSPRGDLIALPKGSTPVDFAFSVHSDIGLTCIGARVNGRIVPLKTILENGDQVEIIRAKNPMPSPSWEKFVITGKARAEIKKFIRSQQRNEYINLGKAIMSKTFEKEGKELKESLLESVLANFKCNNIEDLYCSLGEGSINLIDVYRAIHPLEKSRKKSLNLDLFSLFNLGSKKEHQLRQKQSVPIKGLIPGMAVHFAECCNPLPGDRIVGIVNTGRGITIHTSDCEPLSKMSSSPKCWINVSWDGGENEKYTARIKISLSNETGSLASIASCIASSGANIVNLKIIGRSLDFFEIIIDLDLKSNKSLVSVISALRALNCIHSVNRYNSN